MPEGLLTIAAFGAGMTGIALYVVGLSLAVDMLLDRLNNKNRRVPPQASLPDGVSASR